MATEHTAGRGEERPASTPHRPATTVERITHQEVPAICTLFKKVADAQPPDVPGELRKSWLPTPLEFTSWMEGVTYFAAWRDGRIIGSIGCEVTHGAGHLVNLVVDPEYRRQGVGSALVQGAIDWARKTNAAVVWIDPLVKLAPAVQFLKHLQFTQVGVLHRYLWSEDVLLFERAL